jgi:hypothetical protein
MDTIPGTDPFGRLGRKDAAAALNITPGTLANWSTAGIGPKAYRPTGGKVFYLAADVHDFALRGVGPAK